MWLEIAALVLALYMIDRKIQARFPKGIGAHLRELCSRKFRLRETEIQRLLRESREAEVAKWREYEIPAYLRRK